MPSPEIRVRAVKRRLRRRKAKRFLFMLPVILLSLLVILFALWMPVLQIYGQSMTPTLQNGEIVVSVKTAELEQGDIIAFYYNNKVLIKRVVAQGGDKVSLDWYGNLTVNGGTISGDYAAIYNFYYNIY